MALSAILFCISSVDRHSMYVTVHWHTEDDERTDPRMHSRLPLICGWLTLRKTSIDSGQE